MKKKSAKKANDLNRIKASSPEVANYDVILNGVVELLESARRTSARATNAIMTATYWEVGRRIVECEQGGENRAEYGIGLLDRLSQDLQARFKRGFGISNLKEIRRFFLTYRDFGKSQTVSGLFEEHSPTRIWQTPSAKSKGSKIPQIQSAESDGGKTLPTESALTKKVGYAAEHWTRPGENPPVGLVLCSQHNRVVAHYTIDRLSDKVLTAEYRLALPDEKTLVAEVERTQATLEQRIPIVIAKKATPVSKKTKRKGGGK